MKNLIWSYRLFARLFTPLWIFLWGDRMSLLLYRIFGPKGHPFIKGCELGCCRD